MTAASQALQRLREGNRRFVSGQAGTSRPGGPLRPSEVEQCPRPHAVVLGCADARVPPEIVFDQDLGQLFVVRVAGHVVGPSQVGSVEFAAQRFGTRLVLVLGHSRCGAVLATLESLAEPDRACSPALAGMVEQLRPAIEPLAAIESDPERLVRRAVRANIHAAVASLSRDSEVLAGLARHDELRIVGAEYSLSTGRVLFLDE